MRCIQVIDFSKNRFCGKRLTFESVLNGPTNGVEHEILVLCFHPRSNGSGMRRAHETVKWVIPTPDIAKIFHPTSYIKAKKCPTPTLKFQPDTQHPQGCLQAIAHSDCAKDSNFLELYGTGVLFAA